MHIMEEAGSLVELHNVLFVSSAILVDACSNPAGDAWLNYFNSLEPFLSQSDL